MTAIPPPGPNNQQRLTQVLIDQLRRHGALLGESVNSFKDLNSSFRKMADISQNLSISFSRADNLQIKSLAIGSSLKKVMEGNSAALNKMQGSFFENAEELLLNYSDGIRENSDDLNALNNRMRLTGQSTDLLRKVAGSLSVVTGGNLDAVSRLTKSNIELSDKFGVTSQSLLEAIMSVNNLVDQASFVGASEQIADLAMSVRGLAGDKTGDQTNRLLNFLLDPKFLQTRFALGLGTIDDQLIDSRISSEERLDLLVKAASIASTKLEELNNVNGLQNKIFKSELALSRFGDSETLRAVINSSKTMQKQLEVQNKFRDDQAKITDSMLAREEIVASYYDMAISQAYPAIIKYLPLIAGAAVAGSFRTTGLDLAVGGSWAARALGGIMRVLGPIGLVAGTAIAFIPEISNLISNFNGTSEKQLQVQKEIAQNTKKPTEKVSKESMNLSDYILRSMTEVVRMPLSQRSNPQLDEIKTIMSDIRSAVERSKTLIPSESARGNR